MKILFSSTVLLLATAATNAFVPAALRTPSASCGTTNLMMAENGAAEDRRAFVGKVRREFLRLFILCVIHTAFRTN